MPRHLQVINYPPNHLADPPLSLTTHWVNLFQQNRVLRVFKLVECEIAMDGAHFGGEDGMR